MLPKAAQEVLENTIAAIANAAAQSLAHYNQASAEIASAIAELVARYGAQALLGSMARKSGGRVALFGTGQERGVTRGQDPAATRSTSSSPFGGTPTGGAPGPGRRPRTPTPGPARTRRTRRATKRHACG